MGTWPTTEVIQSEQPLGSHQENRIDRKCQPGLLGVKRIWTVQDVSESAGRQLARSGTKSGPNAPFPESNVMAAVESIEKRASPSARKVIATVVEPPIRRPVAAPVAENRSADCGGASGCEQKAEIAEG